MVRFVGAGCGDKELITIKGANALKKADAVLYTGSLIQKDILSWCKKDAILVDSQNMSYKEIFEFFLKFKESEIVRLHTGDPTLFSTIAKQIVFLKKEKIAFEVIPGISAAFGASATLGIEYTIPEVSQTLILTRIEGKTPQPENLDNILRLKNSSLVFYLSVNLIKKLKDSALKLGYDKNTPCWVVHKATWADERVYKGTISDIEDRVSHVKGVALVLFGDFLYQQEKNSSFLYNL
jgi:precorrin-4/cobalt-precorrin-4 C11-methyltransferase